MSIMPLMTSAAHLIGAFVIAPAANRYCKYRRYHHMEASKKLSYFGISRIHGGLTCAARVTAARFARFCVFGSRATCGVARRLTLWFIV